jgi:hypothetical protein
MAFNSSLVWLTILFIIQLPFGGACLAKRNDPDGLTPERVDTGQHYNGAFNLGKIV